jgi:16S rRNA (adenine1518-N6/adenine1519-N6)-dimethyltransferase
VDPTARGEVLDVAAFARIAEARRDAPAAPAATRPVG